VSRKWDVRAWIRFIWLKTGTPMVESWLTRISFRRQWNYRSKEPLIQHLQKLKCSFMYQSPGTSCIHQRHVDHRSVMVTRILPANKLNEPHCRQK
jgi:hypothetical protein